MSKQRTPDQPALLTAAQAGALLGIGRCQLNQLARAGRLDVVRVHARLQLYTRQSVERYARERRPPGQPPKRKG